MRFDTDSECAAMFELDSEDVLKLSTLSFIWVETGIDGWLDIGSEVEDEAIPQTLKINSTTKTKIIKMNV